MASKERIRSTELSKPVSPPQDPGAPVTSPHQHSDISVAKGLFEVAIVAVGVLLALGVDEIRQSNADRALADEAEAAMQAETEQNRVRLITKLSMLHRSSQALATNSALGPTLVRQRSNMQVELADAAWTMAQETGALRLMDQQDRQSYGTIYASQEIYNRILGEEMTRWAELAASRPGDRSLTMWEAYARRVASGACISLMRIERFRNPQFPISRLQRGCATHDHSAPPEQLYEKFGLTMPDTRWRPGSDF